MPVSLYVVLYRGELGSVSHGAGSALDAPKPLPCFAVPRDTPHVQETQKRKAWNCFSPQIEGGCSSIPIEDDASLPFVEHHAMRREACGEKSMEPLRGSNTRRRENQVSSPGESHPQALSEPDLNLSAHPAPIIQSMVISSSAIGKRALAAGAQGALTNAPPSGDASTF